MTKEELRDHWPFLSCDQCKFSGVSCKRIDGKEYKRATPWFLSHHSGCPVCSEFVPADWCKWLCEHWACVEDFIDEEVRSKYRTVALVYGDDKSVWYNVTFDDWFNGTFLDEHGLYKYVYRQYYKRHKPSERFPTGYELVKEYRE